MNKIKQYENKLKKVKLCAEKGHNYYEGKYIPTLISQLEFEISTRSRVGNKVREAFTK